MNNPFEQISSDLSELKTVVLSLQQYLIQKKQDKFYTLKEAGELLGVSEQTVRRNIKRGNIKAQLLGKKTVIQHAEIFENLAEVKSLKYKR